MTDRDTFAAAALTGLLCNGDFSMECIPLHAFSMADAMLRERSRAGQNSSSCADSAAKCTERDSANHDAAPAARASVESVAPQPTTRGDSDRADKAAPRPSEGTGDTPATHATPPQGSEPREGAEPVAWAVEQPDGEFAVLAFNRQRAEDYATASDRVVPLYRSPTLTSAEWEAVLAMACHCDTRSGLEWVRLSATLRGLLVRLA